MSRTLLRLARRNARHNLLRTVLVVLLIAAPVAAATAAAVGIRNTRSTPEDSARAVLGRADQRITAWNATDLAVAWISNELEQRVAPGAAITIERTAFAPISLGGSPVVGYTEIVDTDLEHPLLAGKFVLEGRSPSRSGEVALSRSLLEDFAIGDRISVTIGDVTAEMEVVGEVTDPYYLDRPLAAVSAAGFDALGFTGGQEEGVYHQWLISGRLHEQGFYESYIAALPELSDSTAPWPRPPILAAIPEQVYLALSPEAVEELIERAPGVTFDELSTLAWEMADPILRETNLGFEVTTRAQMLAATGTDTLSRPPVLGTLAAGLLLAEVALVAAAAYATGIRRRLREIGLLASVGADARQIRTVVLGEAAVAGLAGALFGVAGGIAGVVAFRPFLEQFADKLIPIIEINPIDLVGPGLAGLAAAIAAAWLPARTASRVSTLTALHGRIPLSEPPRWLTPASIGLTGFGLFLLLVARDSYGEASAVLGGLGVVLAIVGAAGLGVPITALLARNADRLPAAPRLVMRDAGRQRTRAAAAIAALIVVLVAPVVVATALETSERQQLTYGLHDADDQVIAINRPHEGPGAYSPTEAQLSEVATILPNAETFPLRVLDTLVGLASYYSDAATPAELRESLVADGVASDWDLGVAVAPSGFLTAIGLPDAEEAYQAGSPVVLGTRSGTMTMQIGDEIVDAITFPAHTVELMPRVLLPAEMVPAIGAGELGTAVAFVNPTPLSGLQRAAVDSLDFAAVRGFPPGLTTAQQQLIAVGVALLVALLIIGMVIALSATESDRDIEVMVAVGAPPKLRRRFLGWQAAYYVAIAAILAVPVGLLLVRTATSGGAIAFGRFGAWDTGTVVVPWDVVALVIIGLPLAAAVMTRGVVRSAHTRPPRRVD